MATLPLITMVVPDGGKIVVPARDMEWDYDSDVVQPVRLIRSTTNAPYENMAGRVTAVMGLKYKDTDPLPFYQTTWTVTDSVNALANFSFPRSQAPVIGAGDFAISVQFEDDDNGIRDTVWRRSRLKIWPIAGNLDQPTVVLPTQVPLGQGPPGGSSAHLATTGPGLAHSGLAPVDGVTPLVGWRILDKDNADPTARGVWVASAGAWQRASGAPTFGQLVVVVYGAQNAGNLWVLATLDPITVGTTALSYVPATLPPSFAITGFTTSAPSVKEIGDTVVNPTFSLAYNRPAAAATIDDGSNPTVTLSSPFTSGLEPNTYSKSVPNQSVTWTATANETGGPSKHATVASQWQGRLWYGIATPGTYNAAFIAGLPSSQLSAVATGLFSIGAGGGTMKGYLAVDAALPQPTIFKDHATGFATPVSLVATVSVTNSFSVTRTINLYATDNFLSAAFTLEAL